MSDIQAPRPELVEAAERPLPRCGSCNCRDRCWGGFLAWRRHQERLPEPERDPRYRPRLMDQLAGRGDGH